MNIINQLLKPGAVAVIPTDTVYGLVARAVDRTAVKRLYALKHREHKPGTIIAGSVKQLIDLGIKARYLKAVEQYWPAPISVIVPCGPELAYLHMGLSSLAVRIPNDNKLLAVLQATGPLLRSSANDPAQPTAVTVDEARKYFGNRVDFYEDGGDLFGHQPSTVIRIVDDAIEIVRLGAVAIDESGRITSVS